MEMKKPIIIGVGELLWDLLPGGKKAGGAPVNFVYHATQMGAEGYAISAIGNDAAGLEIAAELEKNNISSSLSVVDHPTGTVEVELKEGIPTYNIIEGVAWDFIPLTNESVELAQKADAVGYGSLSLRSSTSRETILTLLSHTRKESLRLFDINIRQSYYSKELIQTLLQQSNALKVNDEELVLLRDLYGLKGSDDEVCKRLINDYQLKYLILTAGSVFSSIYTETEVSTIQTPRVEAIDTVGAGDSFSGSFVYALLTGKSLQKAHRIAVETAAFVCTQKGAWPKYDAFHL